MEKLSLNSKEYRKNKKQIKNTLCSESTCTYCNGTLSTNSKKLSYATIDHVKPRSLGGTHDKANLVVSCVFCNSRKSSKTTVLFFRLNTPKSLSKDEYYNLNQYLEFSNRLETLKNIEQFIAEDDMEQALLLLEKSKELGGKQRLFNNLVDFIKMIMGKVRSVLLQIKTILTRVQDLIKAIEVHYNPVAKKVSNINFSTYSLIA